MAEQKVIVQYGQLLVEEVGKKKWSIQGLGEIEHFDSLVEALSRFDEALRDGDLPQAQIVWPSDREAVLELLSDSGIEEFGVTVPGGLAILDYHWIPCEFLDEYGGNIDAHLELVASVDWTTGSREYYRYQDFYIVSAWKPEKGLVYEIDYDLPEDEEYDEVDDGELEFARFIGVNSLERDDWFDLPTDATKLCDLTSWWEYGECEIAELAVYSAKLKNQPRVLVYEKDRKTVIGIYGTFREVIDGMTIEDGVRYNVVSPSMDEWWDTNTPEPKFEF